MELHIVEEDVFTLSAANVSIHIKDVKKAIRLAIYKANNKKRVETHSIWFGDGNHHKRSRSFHVAILRPLNPEERYWIENVFKEICEKERWGNPERFFQWGVHLKNAKGAFSSDYLFNHEQVIPLKVSNGGAQNE